MGGLAHISEIMNDVIIAGFFFNLHYRKNVIKFDE